MGYLCGLKRVGFQWLNWSGGGLMIGGPNTNMGLGA